MKRYQVFVSSTYEDLKEERNEVLQALLELDCIPCGMEYFPATDDTQWNYIKGLIEICDYYIVIIGGRYGSEDDQGISFTEKEYRYAVSKNIPVIAFYHSRPGELPVNKTDNNPDKAKKLEKFKKLVQKKLCKQWENKDQLGAVASRSMSQLMKSHPRIGWIRADKASNEEVLNELLDAKRKVDKLELELKDLKEFELNKEELSSGDDIVSLNYFILIEDRYTEGWRIADDNKFTWNELFDAIAPKIKYPLNITMFNSYLNQYLKDKLEKKHRQDFKTIDDLLKNGFRKVRLHFGEESLDTIRIQLKALGLITERQDDRAKKKVRVIELTKQGQQLLLKRKAIRKK
jgi:hypothetical protein